MKNVHLFSYRQGEFALNIRQLVAMNILKEGAGSSDEQLFENCRYNQLWRKALGLFSLDNECPSPASYYLFRAMICDCEGKSGSLTNEFLRQAQINGRIDF